MSFAVSLDDGRLEYGGNDLSTLFAQRANLLRPRFLLMLRDLLRFYREAPRKLAGLEGLSLGDYLGRDPLRPRFPRRPPAADGGGDLVGAPRPPCSISRRRASCASARTTACSKVTDRPIWRAVTGGSRSYIPALTAPYRDRIRLGTRIIGIARDAFGVALREADGTINRHDHVVVATHADTALAMLDVPTPGEREILGAFRYSRNRAVLHRDATLMPHRRKVWSSWNFLGRSGGDAEALCVTYWMNRLQSLAGDTDYFVTLNPTRAPRDVIYETTYEHPIFDLAALAAQRRLWSLQGNGQSGGKVWFAGAHFGAGFHEDGLQAGLAVAEALGGVRRPWQVEGESSRIVLPVQELAA